jgi:hypothetical protein
MKFYASHYTSTFFTFLSAELNNFFPKRFLILD